MKLKKIRYCVCATLFLCALALTGNGIRMMKGAQIANGDSVESVFNFGGEIEEVQNDYVFKDYFNGNTVTGETDKGLAVFSSTSGATVAYNKEINFNALTADEPIIETYVLYGEGFEIYVLRRGRCQQYVLRLFLRIHGVGETRICACGIQGQKRRFRLGNE